MDGQVQSVAGNQNDIHKEQQGYDIIRRTAFHRDFTSVVPFIDPVEHEAVRDSIMKSPSGACSASLGTLDSLPPEILHEICIHMDIKYLFQFRNVNRHFRQVVLSVIGFKKVVQHALEALCIIMRSGIATSFTLGDLFNVLGTPSCHFCHSFGPFFYLLTFTRCCFHCLDSEPELMVMLISDAVQSTGVTRELIHNSVPVLKPEKGVFPKNGEYIVLGKHIVKLVGESDCKPLDLFDDEIYSGRYMAATILPHVDAAGKVESGVCCIGCEMAHERHFQTLGYNYDELEPIFKVYSHQGFLKHFKTCPRAQKQLLDSRNDGEVQDDTMKFISRHGWPVDKDSYIMSDQVMD